MTAKPVYDRLQTLIKNEWWTKAAGRTDASGSFATRAFFGTHRLTAQLADGRSAAKEVRWEAGGANRFELTLT